MTKSFFLFEVCVISLACMIFFYFLDKCCALATVKNDQSLYHTKHPPPMHVVCISLFHCCSYFPDVKSNETFLN